MASDSPPVLEPIETIRPPTKDISMVLGCYNAGNVVEENTSDLVRFLDTLDRSYELLVVDDGSQDASLAILRRLEKTFPSLVVLRNSRNMGKGFSIRNGILNSSGKFIIFTDLDMAFSKGNLLTVLEKLESGCPIVVGNRRHPKSVYTVNNVLVKYVYRRHLYGMAFNFLARKLFGFTTRDTQSGLKGFHRHAAMQIFERVYTDGFLFDIEIFIRARKLGIPIEEIPVHVTYSTDETTIQHLHLFFSILPQLMRIKHLQLQGAYDGPVLEKFSSRYD